MAVTLQEFSNIFKASWFEIKIVNDFLELIIVCCLCKVVIYNYVFYWLLFHVKFDCNYVQSFVPCISCGFYLLGMCVRDRECEDSRQIED